MAKDQDVVDLEDELDDDAGDEVEETVETVSASFVANKLKVDPKTFRRFMRAKATQAGGVVGTDTPGSGGRYAIPLDEVPELMEAFNAWAKGPKSDKKSKVVEIGDEDYDEEELDEEDFVLEDEVEDDDSDEDDEADDDEDEGIEEVS